MQNTSQISSSNQRIESANSMPAPDDFLRQNPVHDPNQLEQSEIHRLQQDFDFILSLCDPEYIRSLQLKGLFDDPDFLYYLHHLQYWQKPEFSSILVGAKSPSCINVIKLILHDLDLQSLEEKIKFKKDLQDEKKNLI